MPNPNFCKYCISWEKNILTRTGGEIFGICNNTGVAMAVALDGKSHLEEGGTFYTEQRFGCIYWRDNNGVLVDVSKIVKDKLL